MNYADLKDAVKAYLECDEQTFNDQFDRFVELAEEDIYRKAQLPDLRKNATSYFVSGDQYLSTPDDYLSPYSLAVISTGTYYFLLPKDVSFIRESFPTPTATGRPRYYSQFDEDNFIVAPTPDNTYQVELHYFYKPEPLSETNPTTWLSEFAENAILFGTVYHGYIFLKGDQDVITAYKMQFDKAIDDLKTIAEGRVRKDTYRQPDARKPT